jgi:hypothetical protein
MNAVTARDGNAIVVDLRAGSHRRNSLPSDRVAVVDVSIPPFGGRSLPSCPPRRRRQHAPFRTANGPHLRPWLAVPARLSNI